MTERKNLVNPEDERFEYDAVDRLTRAHSTSGTPVYDESYQYDNIGNITSMNGVSYGYPTNGIRPHGVTSIGSTNYTYDDNGNMNVGSSRIWNVENMLTSVTKDGVTDDFVYDGDGNRVEQTSGGQTTLYINQYYEKVIAGTDVGKETLSYYLGGTLIAQRTILSGTSTTTYIHQDSLGSTSVVSNSTGASISTMTYTPFGLGCVTPDTLGTKKEFTGQRLDATGLYYYNARYYDPLIGRFISADTVVQDLSNPQTLNRYSYCINNPLKYTDPSGNYLCLSDRLEGELDAGEAMGLPLDEMADAGILIEAYGELLNSKTAGDTAMSLLLDPNKAVTLEFGPPNGSAIGQTLPTNLFAAAWDAIKDKASEIDWTITLDPSLKGTANLVPSLAHELYHANDSRLSDSVQEEVMDYRFGDQVADELTPGVSHNSFSLRGLNIDNNSDLKKAYATLSSQCSLYEALPFRPAAKGTNDLCVALTQGWWAINPSWSHNINMGGNPWIY